jgi:glycolate oxidase iron-sulfur subunit
MRALAEERLAPSREVARHFDLCLNCRACETACPAGVHYGLLLETTRARLVDELPPTRAERVRNAILKHVFPFPERLDFILATMRVGAARVARAGPRAARAVAAEVRPRRRRALARRRARRRAHGARRLPALRRRAFEGAGRVVPHLPHAGHLSRDRSRGRAPPARGGRDRRDPRRAGLLRLAARARGAARAGARAGALRWFEDEDPFDLVATDVAGCGATLRVRRPVGRGRRARRAARARARHSRRACAT